MILLSQVLLVVLFTLNMDVQLLENTGNLLQNRVLILTERVVSNSHIAGLTIIRIDERSLGKRHFFLPCCYPTNPASKNITAFI